MAVISQKNISKEKRFQQYLQSDNKEALSCFLNNLHITDVVELVNQFPDQEARHPRQYVYSPCHPRF
ncbi:hypothetical protein [Hydrotalea sp.]|uniref:hypothetical protein n=1 Tax=Hydrotalea sp. TaxID=2881279 RepID=UPI00260EFF93|nr:hypothetical protein [Hydrotalea sp.]